MLCNSTAAYATKPEYVYKTMGGMLMPTGDKVAVNHISVMDGCGTKDVVGKQMTLGQKWTTTGYYDYNKATPNEVRHKETGKTAPGEVMAISIVLVAVKPGKCYIYHRILDRLKILISASQDNMTKCNRRNCRRIRTVRSSRRCLVQAQFSPSNPHLS